MTAYNMGKSYSVDRSYGELAIQIERLRYTPGEQVNGWVFLKLVKPFPAAEMRLVLKGKEKAKFTEVYHSGKHRHVSVFKEKTQFYGYHYIVPAPAADHFPAGQYSYPFSFVLPHNLRSTFNFPFVEEGHNCYGIIHYGVKAVLKDDVHKRMLFERGTVVVHQPATALPQAARSGQFAGQVKAYCGVDKGVVSVTGFCDKGEYVSGSQAVVGLEVDCSRMKADVRRIKCRLVVRVSLQAQGHFKVKERYATDLELLGVPRGQTRLGASGLSFNMPIQTLGPLQPSVSGERVRCDYSIEAKLDVDRCKCCQPSVKMHIPVGVANDQAPPFMLPFTMQDNWRPTVMPLTVCQPSAEHLIDAQFEMQARAMMGKGV